LILTEQESFELSAIEDVTMVGYPIGLWDKFNNLPIFRRGTTAFHPGIDFENEAKGLVDMACFPGSSGSPIFILNENIFSDKKGTTYLTSRIKLIGILFSGPVYDNKSEVIEEQDFRNVSITKTMVNLGYYIKARELNYFKEKYQKLISSEEQI
jgi:hypothetical protein